MVMGVNNVKSLKWVEGEGGITRVGGGEILRNVERECD